MYKFIKLLIEWYVIRLVYEIVKFGIIVDNLISYMSGITIIK